MILLEIFLSLSLSHSLSLSQYMYLNINLKSTVHLYIQGDLKGLSHEIFTVIFWL
jgi:hypothetical protein